MNAVWLGAIAVFAAVFGPVVLVWFQNQISIRTARLLLESNKDVAEQAQKAHQETTAALGQIHTLVNSNLTDAQRLQLAAMRALQLQSAQVITMKQDRGVPTEDDVKIAAELAAAIKELAGNIAHKQEQTDIADADRQRG